jgi:putative tricarboxylic transport membrane protein
MNADRISAVVWLAIGLVAVSASVSLGLGTAREPGSGFLGFLTSGFISLMAMIIFIQSLGKNARKKDVAALWKGLRWQRPVATCLITVGYILIFEWLWFAVSTFVFLIALLKGMERLSWWKALAISVVCTGLCYLLLSFSLESTLPRGIFRI